MKLSDVQNWIKYSVLVFALLWMAPLGWTQGAKGPDELWRSDPAILKIREQQADKLIISMIERQIPDFTKNPELMGFAEEEFGRWLKLHHIPKSQLASPDIWKRDVHAILPLIKQKRLELLKTGDSDVQATYQGS